MTEELIAPARNYLLIADERLDRGSEFATYWEYVRVLSDGSIRVTSDGATRIIDDVAVSGTTLALIAPARNYLLIA